MTTAPSREGPINPKYQIMKFSDTIKQLETMQGKVESRIQTLKETKNNLICSEGATLDDDRIMAIYSELHVLYDTKSEIKAAIDTLCKLQEINL